MTPRPGGDTARLLKVATPLTAFTVTVPLSAPPPGLAPSATVAEVERGHQPPLVIESLHDRLRREQRAGRATGWVTKASRVGGASVSVADATV